MRMRRIEKKGIAVLLIITTLVSFPAGCGSEAATKEQDGDISAVTEQDGEGAVTEGAGKDMTVTSDGTGELISDEDAAALQYMKKYMLEDSRGNGASYPVYAPDGSDGEDGCLGYIGHGIEYFASVCSGGDEEIPELPYMVLNDSVEYKKQEWEYHEYSDAQFSEVVENGPDRYAVASAMGQDLYETAYQKTILYYLDVPKTGVGVLWNLEISEIQADETTGEILAEIGRCYGIDLESLMPSGEWAKADAERQMEAQDVYEPEKGDLKLEKVEGYQYLGKTVLSFGGGKVQCPVMAPMGYQTSAKETHITSSMHGVFTNISGSPTGTDQYVPLMRMSVDDWYERKLNDERAENRNVHKSEIMEMSGYKNAWYYVGEYETPDSATGEYYKQVEVSCWMIVEEKFALICEFTLREEDFDASTNALLKELETAYGIDLSGYYNEE